MSIPETYFTPRRGVIKAGEKVQLLDPKGKSKIILLEENKVFQSHQGDIAHKDIINLYEGSNVVTTRGISFLIFRPLVSEYVNTMPRGAAIIYPKDIAQIIQIADIYPGARVLEAGIGSGALSLSILRSIGTNGVLYSFEKRSDFFEIAQANIKGYFGNETINWKTYIGELQTEIEKYVDENSLDRVILDMLAPWECVAAAAYALAPGGVFISYVTTVTQLSKLVYSIRIIESFSEPKIWESLMRDWHVEGLSVRPSHRMSGHTGFLVMTRKLVPGNFDFKSKKVLKTLMSESCYEDYDSNMMEEVNISDKKIRKKIRKATEEKNIIIRNS